METTVESTVDMALDNAESNTVESLQIWQSISEKDLGKERVIYLAQSMPLIKY